MADPISAGIALARPLVAKGIDAVRKQFPLYPRFWKSFKRQLQAETNIAWKPIENGCHLSPDFIGIAEGLIQGTPGARDAFEEHIKAIDFLSDEAYEDSSLVFAAIVNAAEVAASEAPRTDRAAGLANTRKIEESVEKSSQKLVETLGETMEQLGSITSDLAGESTSTNAAQEALDESGPSRAEGLTPTAGLSAGEIERIVERAKAELADADTETLTAVEEAIRTAASFGETSRETTLRVVGISGSAADDADSVLKQLRAEGEDATAAQLEQILAADGIVGIVRLMRRGRGPSTVPAFVAEARLVAIEGYFAEAENAYLKASKLAESDSDKARQLVRAANTALIRGNDERYQQFLEDARALAPDHPSVALTDARISHDADFILERLADMQPESDLDRALLHTTRGQAQLARREFQLARDELTEAEQADPANIVVQELRANIPLAEAKEQASTGQSPDPQALSKSASEFLAIAERVEGQARAGVAAQLKARAAEGHALAGDIDQAGDILESIDDPEFLPDEARLDLGQAAMISRRPEMVIEFIGDNPSGVDEQLLRADAQMLGDFGPEDRAEAVDVLRKVLTADEPAIQLQASFALLVGAAFHTDVPWESTASRILGDARPTELAVLMSHRLWTEGKEDEAEKSLLPLAADIRVLRQLRDFAARREDWATARDRARDVARATEDADDELAYADTLRRSGAPREAREKFLSLGRDTTLDISLRGRAFVGATSSLDSPDDYTAMLEVTSEWQESLPEDPEGLWNKLFALTRLTRYSDALDLVRRADPDPDLPQRAILLAEILTLAADPAEAVQKIADLSDRYGNREEALESQLIGASLKAEDVGAEIPAKLGKRVKQTFDLFKARFPNSASIQVIDVPSTPEGISELFRKLTGDSIELQKDAAARIEQGELPVNALAAASPAGSVITTWSCLGRLPLGLASEAVDAADRDAARKAIGSAAIWDSSSIYVTGGIGGETRDVIAGSMPGSVISNETLEDADRAAAKMGGSGKGSHAIHDRESGEFLGIQERTDDEVERQEAIGEGSRGLARRFEARPGDLEHADERLREMYEKTDAPEWRALLSSVALAKRMDRPLYSDDRWTRQFARAFGIQAFGTLALLDELIAAGVLSEDKRKSARKQLIESGAWGICATGDELVVLSRESGELLSPALAYALQDRAAWRGRPADHLRHIVELLQDIYDRNPDRFSIWVRRVVSAAQDALPETAHSWAPTALLAVAWDIGEEHPIASDACFHALVREVQQLPRRLGDDNDPVLEAINWWLSLYSDRPAEVRYVIFTLISRRLPMTESVRAWKVFIQRAH